MTEPDNHNTFTCVIPGCKRQRNRGLICEPHFDTTSTRLIEAEADAAYLPYMPTPERVGTNGPGQKYKEPPAPPEMTVLALMDTRSTPNGDTIHDDGTTDHAWGRSIPSVHGTICGWAEWVRGQRQLTTGDGILSTDRRFLATHLEWIAAQPEIEQFYKQINDLWRALRVVLKHPQARPVGLCPTQIDDHECGGELWADETFTAVECGRCHRDFPKNELQHLGAMLLQDQWVPTFRASWLTGIPERTIQHWAKKNRIASKRNGKNILVTVGECTSIRSSA